MVCYTHYRWCLHCVATPLYAQFTSGIRRFSVLARWGCLDLDDKNVRMLATKGRGNEGSGLTKPCRQSKIFSAGSRFWQNTSLCDGPRSRITIAVAPVAMNVSQPQVHSKNSPRIEWPSEIPPGGQLTVFDLNPKYQESSPLTSLPRSHYVL